MSQSDPIDIVTRLQEYSSAPLYSLIRRQLLEASDEIIRLRALVDGPAVLRATPELAGSKALVLYFPTDADRDDFAALMRHAMPNARSVSL